MTAVSLDFTYRYAFPSEIVDTDPSRAVVRLATSDADRHPYFFDSAVAEPAQFAEALLCLTHIVRTHFFDRRPGLLDPVVTCGEQRLRFEGFSACCGIYTQCTFRDSAFTEPIVGRGTTNIDINDQLRNGLARLRQARQVRLAVGTQELALQADQTRLVEKKVKLPLRWLRGFCEVQAYLAQATFSMAIPASEMLRFVRGLPRQAARNEPLWAVPSGRSLRLTSRRSDDAVPIAGTERLRVIEPLLRTGRGQVSVWCHRDSGASVWSVDNGKCQFLIAISPELYRGFSGEGQVLSSLATATWQNAIDQVKAHLNWQGALEPNYLAAKLGIPELEIRAALSALATRGLVGYDVAAGCYYHRELPFQADLVESLQPRLIAARKLLDDQKIKLHQTLATGQSEWLVEGSGVEHLVRLSDDGDRCTCTWFSKHQNNRGPCKHILAARMKSDGDNG